MTPEAYPPTEDDATASHKPSPEAVDLGKRMTAVQHFLLFAAVASPTAIGCLFFSVMGYGDDTYVWLNEQHYSTAGPIALAVGIAVLLHVLDASSWKGWLVLLRYAAFLAIALGLGVGCCLAAKTYPYASLQFIMLLIPASVFFTRRVLMPCTPLWRFFVSLSFSLLVVAALVIFYFTLWVFALDPPSSRIETGWNPDWTNYWGGEVKVYWRRRLECEPYNASAAQNDVDCYDAAFLWWFFPAMLSIALLLFALTCRLLSRTLKPTAAHPDIKLVKMLIQLVCLAFGMIYVAASIASAGLGLAKVVLLAMFCLVIVTLAVVGGSIGWDRLFEAIKPLFDTITASNSTFEYVLALGILCGIIPITFYLLVSFVHQSVFRRFFSPWCTLPPQGGSYFTEDTSHRLAKLRTKHWGSIWAKVIILGLVYLVMQVLVSQGVVVFLSGLNALLEPVHLAAVLVIFLAVGIAMFLIPIIPGVPVYICAGVMIPWNMMSDEEKQSTSSTAPSSFWNGVVIACVLSSALKFIAIAIQQEVIGRLLGQRVAIRAACGMNSSAMRSIRVVLQRPGMTADKSMILVGGPDWPTSVATGIMGLSLPQMLLGSVPVLVLIIPSVLLGAFQLLSSREGWEVLSDIVTLLALAMQLGAMIGFAAVVEKASVKYAADLAVLPIDEEVRVLDEQQEVFVKAWRDASDWTKANFPPVRKGFLLVGAALTIFAFHMSIGFRCFERVSVADRYHDPPISSNPFNVIRPPGWALLILFLLATACILIHRSWLTKRTNELVASGEYADAREGDEEKRTAPLPAAAINTPVRPPPEAKLQPAGHPGSFDVALNVPVPPAPALNVKESADHISRA